MSVERIKSLRFQKNINIVVLIILFLLLIIPISGSLTLGHDLYFHLYRIQGIHDGLINGEFPVRINTAYLNGYGYPVGLCYGDFYLYIPAIFEIIGFNLIDSYKLFLIFFNMFVILSSYYSFYKITKNNSIAIFACCLWVLAPYRLVCVYLRASVGEYLAQSFLPLLICASLQLFGYVETNSRLKSCILISVSVFSIIVSHILSLVLFAFSFLPLILFSIIHSKDIRSIGLFFFSVLFGCLLAAYFIIPFLDIYKNGNLAVNSLTVKDKADLASAHATYLPQLFELLPHLSGASVAGTPAKTEMPQTLGLSIVVSFFAFIYIFASKKYRMPLVGKAICASVILTALLVTNCFPWWEYDIPVFGNIVSVLSTIQYPWRFIGGLSFLIILFICFIYNSSNRKANFIRLAYLFTAISIICGTYSLMSVQTDNDQIDFVNIDGCPDKFGFMNGEYLPNNFDMHDGDLNYFNGELRAQNCQIKNTAKSNRSINFYVKAKKGSHVILPRFYYKYYEVTNDLASSITKIDNYNGLVQVVFLKNYSGPLNVEFIYPNIWHMADMVSVVCFLVLAVVVIFRIFSCSIFSRKCIGGYAVV